MKKHIIILLVILCFLSSITLKAQLTGIPWNTFLGCGTYDEGRDIAVDSSGKIYVIGKSDSTWGSPINAHSGGEDAYVACVDSSGNLIWNTFLGSSVDDWGFGIALGISGNIYVTGRSYATWGSPINACSGDDAYVACLDSSGNLLWNTFMGSISVDMGQAIALDSSGNIYVTGKSYASWGSPINPYSSNFDVFVAAIDNSGNLLWNTFLGSNSDYGSDITLDNSGNIYIAGYSYATWGSPVNAYSGGSDAFVACLDGSGNRLWNTFLGSTNDEYGYGIALDSSGNIYLTGYGYAGWGSPINAHSGGTDTFVAFLDSSGNLLGNTFLGSSGADYGYGIAIDNSGNICVTGVSGSSWGSPINAHSGAFEAYMACLDSSGNLMWNTFLGSSGTDYGRGMAPDNSGNIFVIGESDASWGSPVNTYSGGTDAFVAKLTTHPIPDITANGSDGPISITQSDTLQIRVSLTSYGITDNADFWLAYKGPSGWVHFNNSSKQWLPGLDVTHQGPLFDLGSKKVFQSSGLSPGYYTFYFGVDMTMNGTITKSCLYYDEVKVTVTSD